MSERKPSFKEWLGEHKTQAHDIAVRANAYFDESKDGLWTWIRDAFYELEDLMKFVEGERRK